MMIPQELRNKFKSTTNFTIKFLCYCYRYDKDPEIVINNNTDFVKYLSWIDNKKDDFCKSSFDAWLLNLVEKEKAKLDKEKQQKQRGKKCVKHSH